eukprot:TRINITY_DN80093_c0_g1_i1.p1 TRINITY_DN80093_c0_g1~~TRINITY_DN80093_c0_g1_i1.p1  ORF type:complete len:419 (-),score=105.30 TRINITY_DN80093_c0_g1_i1:105-1361(-)
MAETERLSPARALQADVEVRERLAAARDACAEESPVTLPAASGGLERIPEALRRDIMAEVEALLLKKEESLFQRGQAEIAKLQQEKQQVSICLTEITAKQEAMAREHAAMHGALIQITSKLEFLATEMKQVLRARCSAPSSGLASSPQPPGEGSSPVASGATAEGPQTPPRATSKTDAADAADGPSSATSATGSAKSSRGGPPQMAPPPLPGSPAVLLSLASALPSASYSSSAAPVVSTPQPGRKAPPISSSVKSRPLNIAECLERAAGSTPAAAAPGSAALPSAGEASKKLPLSACLLGPPGLIGPPSTTGQACDEVPPPPLPTGEGAASNPALGKLRADAPTFVPGGGGGSAVAPEAAPALAGGELSLNPLLASLAGHDLTPAALAGPTTEAAIADAAAAATAAALVWQALEGQMV